MLNGQLSFFKRLKSQGKYNGAINLISLHWENSLTWRFVLSRTKGKKFKVGGFHNGRYGTYVLELPFVGHFQLNTQPNMPRHTA